MSPQGTSASSPIAHPNPWEIAADLVEPRLAVRHRWYGDPVSFAQECIKWPTGLGLISYQGEILAALAERHRVAIRAPRGAAKTATLAIAILWFAITRDMAQVDWKCFTTAGAWRQLERYLWPEIHIWANALRWDRIGRSPFDPHTELLGLLLKLRHGQAFAAASDDPGFLEGAHARSMMVVLDESKSIAAPVFDAVEGALSGPGEMFAIASSTPGEPAGRFYDICSRKPGLEDWFPYTITLDKAIEAGQITEAWADQRRRQWGTESAVYQNHVLGEFASSGENGVIPLAWVEAAFARWDDWKAAGAEAIGPVVIGVDVARFGTDQTAICLRQGDVMLSLDRHSLEDTMQTTGRVAAKLKPGSKAVVDVIGVGGGVVDRLREQRLTVEAFNASERSDAQDRSGELGFLNRRADAWWGLREQLDPAYDPTLCLLRDDLLLGDLCAPRWTVTSAGKIQIESKDDIRKRLGRSTDAGDAVVQAFLPERSRALTFLRALDGHSREPQANELMRQYGLP